LLHLGQTGRQSKQERGGTVEPPSNIGFVVIGGLEFGDSIPGPSYELLFDTAFSYTYCEPTNPEHPKGGIMTALEALESLLDSVVHERTTIKDQMKNVYPIPGGFAYDRAKPDEATQYDPSTLPPLDDSFRIEMGSVLAGKLEYNRRSCTTTSSV